jgi:sugar fermentation stimulation protein A
MQFEQPLQSAILVKRYKRFFADAQLADGSIITLHCPNTGSMQGCNLPEKRVWYSTSSNQNRKLPYTWEIIEVAPQVLVGVNTHRANHLVQEAIEQGVIAQLQGYQALRREVAYGDEKSRIDFLLESADKSCFVEVKNVTLGEANGQGYFPDAVTTRGQKHLRELAQVVQQGARAVLLFCVQHSGIERVAPAAHIDPDYAVALQQAMEQGVEVFAYKAVLSPENISLQQEIPVHTL